MAGIAAGVAVIWFDLAVVRPVPGQADAGIFVVVHVIALAGLIAFSAWALRRGVAPFARAALLGFTIVTSVVLGLLTACFAMFGSY